MAWSRARLDRFLVWGTSPGGGGSPALTRTGRSHGTRGSCRVTAARWAGTPAQSEERLEDDLRGVRVACPGHAEKRRLLPQQVGRRDLHRHPRYLLKWPVGRGVAHIPDSHAQRRAVGMGARVTVVDDP